MSLISAFSSASCRPYPGSTLSLLLSTSLLAPCLPAAAQTKAQIVNSTGTSVYPPNQVPYHNGNSMPVFTWTATANMTFLLTAICQAPSVSL